MTTRPAEASPISSTAPTGDRSDARGNGGPINSTGAGADPSSNVTLRALISGREAGVIIGKGGKAVAELRDATETKAGVSKAVPGVHDRVFSVSGALEGVSKAYFLVADAILQNPIATTDPTLVVPPAATATTTTIRLLISHNLMGSIIGKQGSKIKEIQDMSGVRMLATKEMLPQSTERIVEVQGSPEAIQTAVQEIGKCLMEDWERAHGTVLYQPGTLGPDGVTAAYPGGVLGGGFGVGATYGGGANRRPSGGNSYANPGPRKRENSATPSTGGDNGRPRGNSNGGSGPPSAGATPENLRTQNISIPSDMVGCIIGKGGSKINEIRRLSGSKISIAKMPHDETGERMFTITGTPEANEKALYLLYNQLESEKDRRVHSVEEEQ